jgi:hypothetical protein
VTRRIADQLVATLAGILIGILLMGVCVPDAWTVAPTPRPSQHADLGPAAPRMTPDGVSPVPSPDVAARTGSPDTEPAPMSASPSPTGTRPAATARPKAATPLRHRLSGTATWFRSPAGVSAAGPALRAAVGPGWRGQRVTVVGPAGTARTVLGDWCACGKGRVIDLDDNVFRAVCGALSRGVCTATVRW